MGDENTTGSGMRDELLYVRPLEVVESDETKPTRLQRMVKMWAKLSEDEQRQFVRHVEGVLPINTEAELIPTTEASRILGVSFYKVKKMAEDGELLPTKVRRDYWGKVNGYLFRRSDVERLKEERGERAKPQRSMEAVVPEEDWDSLPAFNYDSFWCVVADRPGTWKRHPVYWANVIEHVNAASCREAVEALLRTLNPVGAFMVQYAFRGLSVTKMAKRLGITQYRAGNMLWEAERRALEKVAEFPPLDTLKADIESLDEQYGCEDAKTTETYQTQWVYMGKKQYHTWHVRRCRLCGHDGRDVLSLYCPAKQPGKTKVRHGAIPKPLSNIEWLPVAAPER